MRCLRCGQMITESYSHNKAEHPLCIRCMIKEGKALIKENEEEFGNLSNLPKLNGEQTFERDTFIDILNNFIALEGCKATLLFSPTSIKKDVVFNNKTDLANTRFETYIELLNCPASIEETQDGYTIVVDTSELEFTEEDIDAFVNDLVQSDVEVVEESASTIDELNDELNKVMREFVAEVNDDEQEYDWQDLEGIQNAYFDKIEKVIFSTTAEVSLQSIEEVVNAVRDEMESIMNKYPEYSEYQNRNYFGTVTEAMLEDAQYDMDIEDANDRLNSLIKDMREYVKAERESGCPDKEIIRLIKSPKKGFNRQLTLILDRSHLNQEDESKARKAIENMMNTLEFKDSNILESKNFKYSDEDEVEYKGYIIEPFTISDIKLGNKNIGGFTKYSIKKGDAYYIYKDFTSVEDAKKFIDSATKVKESIEYDFEDITNMSDAKIILKKYGIDLIKKDSRNYVLKKDGKEYTFYVLDNPNEVRKDLVKAVNKLTETNVNIDEAYREPVDDLAVSELVLYIKNDSQIYNRCTMAVVKNLARKKSKGVYDKDLAVKAFEYVAKEGANKYTKEFGGTFNPATRNAVAKELLNEYEDYIEELADKKKVKESIDYTDENYLYKPYWYFTKHGMGPGSVPAKMSVWTWFETPEGTYFASSKVLDTQELEEYEIVEKQPSLEDIPEKSRVDIQDFLEEPISDEDKNIVSKENLNIKEDYDVIDTYYMVDIDSDIKADSATKQEAIDIVKNAKSDVKDYVCVTRTTTYFRDGRQEKSFEDVIDAYIKDGKWVVKKDMLGLLKQTESFDPDTTNNTYQMFIQAIEESLDEIKESYKDKPMSYEQAKKYLKDKRNIDLTKDMYQDIMALAGVKKLKESYSQSVSFWDWANSVARSEGTLITPVSKEADNLLQDGEDEDYVNESDLPKLKSIVDEFSYYLYDNKREQNVYAIANGQIYFSYDRVLYMNKKDADYFAKNYNLVVNKVTVNFDDLRVDDTNESFGIGLPESKEEK